jgi:hypothetical protein
MLEHADRHDAIEGAGLSDRVRFFLRDYRHQTGRCRPLLGDLVLLRGERVRDAVSLAR